MNILLDSDGVLFDFHAAALKAHDRMELYDAWPKGTWEMPKTMGISETEFWGPVDTYDFWAGVEPYAGAREFYDALNRLAPVTICTAPSRSTGCVVAKIQALRKLLGEDVALMIGARKHLMARPSNLLIDDYESNVKAFRAQGGPALLVARPWNSLPHSGDVYHEIIIQTRAWVYTRKGQPWM